MERGHSVIDDHIDDHIFIGYQRPRQALLDLALLLSGLVSGRAELLRLEDR
jgi:hypothetical protein